MSGSTPARSTELLPPPLGACTTVSREERTFAASSRASRARAKKYRASSSPKASRPGYGEVRAPVGSTASERLKPGHELVDGHAEDLDAAVLPEPALDGRRLRIDRPGGEPTRTSQRLIHPLQDDAEVPVAQAVAEEQEVAPL